MSNEQAAPYLEHANDALNLRTKLISLSQAVYHDARATITDVAVQGGTASVSYSFVLGDKPAFIPLTAELDEANGHWIVSAASICRLADAAALANC